jgi:hypothetical protein
MNLRRVLSVILLLGVFMAPAHDSVAEAFKPAKAALVASGFSITVEKDEAEECRIKAVSPEQKKFEVLFRVFPTAGEAQQETLKVITVVSAGVKALAWSEEHVVGLHRQFLVGHSGRWYYKLMLRGGEGVERC